MKCRNLLFFFYLIVQYNFCIAQIDISDRSTKPKIKAIPYDGSFMNFNSMYGTSDKEKMAGVVGEKVTLIEGYFDLKNTNGVDVSFDTKDKVINKTFTVLEYIDDYQPRLKIKNELGTFIFSPNRYDQYLFNRYLDYVKEKYTNKVFVPLYNKSTLTSIGGNKIDFSGTKDYLISSVKYSKLESGYGIVFEINNSFECIMSDGEHSSFPEELKKGWVELKGTGVLESNVVLLEKEVFKKFIISNKPFVNIIRDKSFKTGMSEKQCRYSWGMPMSSFYTSGFKVKVLVYGSGINSINLYFKNDRLVGIR